MGGAPNIASNNLPNAGDTQWMSQSAYQNIDLDKVDWAALAQQWIHMKESTGPVASSDPIPNAPPPPRFTNTAIDYEEQGEAPMEVEHDEEQLSNENSVNLTAPPPPTNVFNQSNQWNSEPNSRGSHQKQWNRSMLKLHENLKKKYSMYRHFQKEIAGIRKNNSNAYRTMGMPHQVKYSTMPNNQMYGQWVVRPQWRIHRIQIIQMN